MKFILKSRCQGKKFKMTHYYLNDDHTYHQCGLMEWAKQFETTDRRVDEDFIDDFRISTVWMGINIHDFEPPLVFETMIFKGGKSIYCACCSTWNEAKEQHETALRWIKNACKEENE